MKVLMIGASGNVGGLILPILKEHPGLELAVYDLASPADPTLEFIPGDVTSAESLARATRGRDAVVYLPMGRVVDGQIDVASSYDVNVKGLHMALEAAVEAGVRRFVHTSTGSVYGYEPEGGLQSEDLPCLPHGVYSLSKHLGEQVCEHFARVGGLSIISLRLWGPISEAEWQSRLQKGLRSVCTGAVDLARAYQRALEVEHTGYDAVFIAGDLAGRSVCVDKARRLLRWEPTYTPQLVAAR